MEKAKLKEVVHFLEKKIEKQGKWGIMKTENAVNTAVEPYL